MEEFGFYECTVQNTIVGEMYNTSHEVELIARGPPFPPYNLTVKSQTSVSVSLSWQPGFDGGYEDTTFILTYRPENSSEKVEHDAIQGIVNSIQVKQLESFTNYAFVLIATNSHNQMSNSSPASVIGMTHREYKTI